MVKIQKKILAVLLVFAISFSFLAVPQPVYAGGGGSGNIFNNIVGAILFVGAIIPGPWSPFVAVASFVRTSIISIVNNDWVGLGIALGTAALGFDGSDVISSVTESITDFIGIGFKYLTDAMELTRSIDPLVTSFGYNSMILGRGVATGLTISKVASLFVPSNSNPDVSNVPNPDIQNIQSPTSPDVPNIQSSATTTQQSVTFDPESVGIGIMGSCPEGYYNSKNKICVPVGQQSCLDIGISGSCPANSTCSTAYGGSCTRGRDAQPGVIMDFSINNPEPSIDKDAILAWDSTGATSCVMNQRLGGLYAKGYVPIRFSKPGTWDFVIRCAGEGGEVKKNIVVYIPEVVARINAFWTVAAINKPIRINWTSSNAQNCGSSLYGSRRISFDTVGNKTVTLACTGRGGTATSSVNIKVVSEQEYLDALTQITTSRNIVQTNDVTLDRLTAPKNPVNIPQSILDSLTTP